MQNGTADSINGNPGEIHTPIEAMSEPKRTPNRLILCFDGTGNSFQGNTSDTNIVKLYDKLDAMAPHQMHYYQPGIGTYTADGGSINKSWWGRFKSNISSTMDQMFGTTFDAHVIAGYRFLMRYYGSGDRIYIFGFSRGAFTARFLARMIAQVGLLSMGNEELVPFVYKIYQDYELGAHERRVKAKVKAAAGEAPDAPQEDPQELFVKNFKTTFCRHEHRPGTIHADTESGIKVHFLGLFDTVNSVGTLDVPIKKTKVLPKIHGTAEHVRHAVAVDERRVKFKPSLISQDTRDIDLDKEDIKEVWFPGTHCDVGGGWPAQEPAAAKQPKTSLQKLRTLFRTEKDIIPSVDVRRDPFQQSDIPLKWMIDELDMIESDQIEWDETRKEGFLKHFEEKREHAIRSRLHDSLSFGGGSSWGLVLMWKMMEYLPTIKHWEYRKGAWQYVTFPLNGGSRRDIPPGSVMHSSVLERMQNSPISSKSDEYYKPTNNVFFDHSKSAKPMPLDHIIHHDTVKHVKQHDSIMATKADTTLLKEPHFVVAQAGKIATDSTYSINPGAGSGKA